jgi:hypothetical protein
MKKRCFTCNHERKRMDGFSCYGEKRSNPIRYRLTPNSCPDYERMERPLFSQGPQPPYPLREPKHYRHGRGDERT